jgi:hypothetical protein
MRRRIAGTIGLVVTLASVCISAAGQLAGVQQTQQGARLRLLAQESGIRTLEGEPIKCGLTILTHAIRNRLALSIPAREALTGLLTRDVMQKSRLSTHFRIHYDTIGANTPAMLDTLHKRIPGSAEQYVDSVVAIAEQVYSFEIGTLCYLPPPGDGTEGGGSEYDIYVEPQPGEYGETVPDPNTPEGDTCITFMRIHNAFDDFVYPDYNRGLPALRVTLAHEFHHAIQIGRYGFWSRDIFYYEITSTWMEDVVFPEVNDYYNYLRNQGGQFRNPGIGFAVADGMIEYSRAIWGHYVAKKFGRDAMRSSWEQIRHMRPITAIDAALRQYSSDFTIAFSEWASWNHFTGPRSDSARYYPDGRDYPLMAELPVDYASPSLEFEGTLESVSSRYYQVLSAPDTLTLVVSNVNVAGSLAGDMSEFPYTCALRSSRPDNSYTDTGMGIYIKLTGVADRLNWMMTYIIDGAVGPASGALMLAEGLAFPNPFRPDGTRQIFIPVTSAVPVRGTLKIFSSNMDLVSSMEQTSSPVLGRQAFRWNGDTGGGAIARSGIYIYVLKLDDRTLKGKIALVRQ